MENKIFNQYGALRCDVPEGNDLNKLANDIDRLIKDYFDRYPKLTPIEVRCINAYLNLNAVCCEQVLRKAMELRKEH